MPDKTTLSEPVPSDSKSTEATQELNELANQPSARRPVLRLSVVGIAAVCLILAVSAACSILSGDQSIVFTFLLRERRDSAESTVVNTQGNIASREQLSPTTDAVVSNSPRSPGTFTPTVTETPTADFSTVVPPPVLFEHADIAYQQGVQRRDPEQLRTALDLVMELNVSDPQMAGEIARLQSQILFARDILNRTVYQNANNTTQWKLKRADGRSLVNPIDFTVNDEGIYIIDSGTLYRGDVSALGSDGGTLTVRAILTPAMQIDEYPIKEIVAVDATNSKDTVFVLDKSNETYRHQIGDGEWSLESLKASEISAPSPLFLNINTYSNRLYLLDPARNQIWRHPPKGSEIGYLPGTLPWLVEPDEPDVNAGIDLAIDGKIYVLWRDGTVVTYDPNEIDRFSLEAADTLSHVQGLEELAIEPAAIFANVGGATLYVADRGRRRVAAFNRHDGDVLWQLMAPDNLDFAALHGVVEKGNHLYILAGPSLYSLDLSNDFINTLPLEGELPTLKPISPPNLETLHPGDDLPPNDPRLPALLATYNFTMPIKGGLLPDRAAVYPGSRRVYRYGVHQGIDLYEKDVGAEIDIDTPVYAAADGVIMRADTNYQEMSLAEVNALLAQANARHITPPETLKKLNGRQIWIDHGNGVVTRYSHLSGVAEGITKTREVQAGQLIGYVGLSGTPDGITGNYQFPHLHFEIRIGDDHQYYLGQWLSIEETRRVFEHIFNVGVRPAYLEFRQNGTGVQN